MAVSAVENVTTTYEPSLGSLLGSAGFSGTTESILSFNISHQMSTSAPTTAAGPENGMGAPERSFTDTVEILIYTVCLCIGGPLNLFSFRKLLRNFNWRPGPGGAMASASSKSGAQITLLKLNLNVADLITMFIYTLSQIIWMITYQWYAGDILCRICKFFHTFGFYLNSFVVACFAIDRAMGTYRLNTLNTSREAYLRVRRMLVCAWIFAFLLSIPQSFIFRVVEPPGMANFKQCTPVWTIIGFEIDLEMSSLAAAGKLSEAERWRLIEQFQDVVKWERVYNIGHLLFVFWIPTLIIITCYAIILCILSSFSAMSIPKRIRTNMSFRNPNRLSTKNISRNSTKPLCVNERLLTEKSLVNDNNDCSDPTENICKENSDLTIISPSHSFCANGNASEEIPTNINGKQKGKFPVARAKSTSLKANQAKPFTAVNRLQQEEIGQSKWAKRISLCSLNILPMRPNGNQPNGEPTDHPRGNSVMVGAFAMQTIMKARQKTKRQAALILLAYLTFWTPYNLLAMVNAFSSKEGTLKEIASMTLPFLNSMIVINPIVNPLIYGLFDRQGKST
ncbi:7 transmembrane receptor (rhodopsin family) domain-containing protein [Ditylenchus destructor]|nr:7 transmembrane receptor (rhodopsin family) domain-containing protein [Ditylenchus destructor]